MTRLLLTLLLATPAFALDKSRLLRAIAEVETGNRPRLGKAMEVGPYQLTPSVLRKHGSAHAYLDWLSAYATSRNVHLCEFNLALAYNAGPKAWRGQAPLQSYDYARRVANIYRILK